MKKNLLLIMIILLGLTATSQVRIPGEPMPLLWHPGKFVSPADTYKNKPGPYNPAGWKQYRHHRMNRPVKDVRISPSFDPTWANRFQTVLDSVMQATGGKGATMAVYTPEEGMWAGVSGISYPGVPVTPGMRFGIGSNTKLFIAATVVRLQEEGLLSLDDHLYQWLPPFQFVDSNTTIRQLLNHESGIWDYWNDSPSIFDQIWSDTSRFWTTEEIINSIGPPHFSPGNGNSYSNTNYVLAGMIIEAATGQTWVQKLHDIIFDPLNLDSTFMGAFESRNGPCAAEWDYWANTVVTNTPMTAEYSQANACGAILATATEMVQWYHAFFNGAMLNESSMQQVLDFEPTSQYGLGIGIGEYGNVLWYNHTGGMRGFVSIALYDVRRDAVICALFNDRESDFGAKLNAIMPVFFDEYPKRADDAGIVSISTPWEHTCNATVIPEVDLQNFGSNPLTSVTINYQVDDGDTLHYNWIGIVNPGEILEVILPTVTVDPGEHIFTCFSSQPNGQPEGYTFNDLAQSSFAVESSPSLVSEIYEGFDDGNFPAEGWTLYPPTILQWGETPLARCTGSGAGVQPNYWVGGTYRYMDMILPQLNISSWYNTDFTFDYAYAMYPGFTQDSLEVSVSSDCGETWTTLFKKGGSNLNTAYSTYNPFYPDSPDDWEHVYFPLAAYEGDLLIRFRSKDVYSNNLFLDNILVKMLTSLKEDNPEAKVAVYPNPFTTSVTFSYPLTDLTHVSLRVFDGFGHLVAEPVNSYQQPGEQKVTWYTGVVPAGVYYCQLNTGGQIGTHKIVKMR